MNQDELKRAIQRGLNAARLLQNTEEAWADVRKELHKMWEFTESQGAETREALYRELHALKAVRARIERRVSEGKKAEAELEHVNGNRTRKRS